MMRKPVASVLSFAMVLSACGGGGGGSGSVVTPPPTGATPTPTPTAVAGCSLRERQDWAAAQLNEWYLFPETLPAGLSPAAYGNVDDYIDALTATARAQGRDRYFTYLTSIAEENAYYASGSSAGYGFRLAYDSAGGRIFVAEAFEGAPALNAGIDRGAQIVAIGTSTATLRTVSSILASQGTAGVTEALGPSAVGTTRVLRVSDAAGTRDLTVAMADYALTPVSSRYGAKVLDDGGRKVGYVNLRTFISTADPALRAAFAQFKAVGITQVIVDLRYNGGGLVSIAQLMGDLMGANRTATDVFDYMVFRPEKSAENETRFFQPKTESIAPIADRVHRQRRHGVGERARGQRLHPLSPRQCGPDRHQHLWQAGGADRSRSRRVRRSSARDRLRHPERRASGQLLQWPGEHRRGELPRRRRYFLAARRSP